MRKYKSTIPPASATSAGGFGPALSAAQGYQVVAGAFSASIVEAYKDKAGRTTIDAALLENGRTRAQAGYTTPPLGDRIRNGERELGAGDVSAGD